MYIEIILLKQAHKAAELIGACKFAVCLEDLPEELQLRFEMVAKSQYKIARFISENRQIPVIQENALGYNYNDREKIRHIFYNTHFSNGLPSSFQELSFEQKMFLIIEGGDGYAVHSGIITKTYSDDLTYANRHNEFATPQSTSIENKAMIDQVREFLTLKKAYEIAQQKVIIIYGFLHYFEDLISLFPNMTLKIHHTVDQQNYDEFNDYYLALIKNRPPVNANLLKQGFDRAFPFLNGYERDPLLIKIAHETTHICLSKLSLFVNKCWPRRNIEDENKALISKHSSR